MDADQPRVQSDDERVRREKEAVALRAHNSVVRIIDRTDVSEGGSGVLVELNGILFLATAKHVVPPKHTFEIARIPGQPPVTLPPGTRSEADDLAAFQLDLSTSAHLRDRAIQPGRILTSLDQRREYRALVVGYPGAYMRHLRQGPVERAESRQGVDAAAFNYSTVTIPEDNWPDEGCEEPSNRDRDMFLRYEPGKVREILWQQHTDWPGPTFGEDSPALPGMSGGAVYLAACREGTVWTPEPILVGLQVSVYHKGAWIRAIQIGRWLDLVARHHPILESVITQIRTRPWSLKQE